MANWNQYYEAMMEGRWRPTIELDKLDSGEYRAHYTDQNGRTIEFVDEVSTYAVNQLQGMLKNEVANGTIVPR